MKNLFLSFIFSICVIYSSNGQPIYRDFAEYEKASKIYNDKWVSYENYSKKINFYKNFKYKKGDYYPETYLDWIAYFKPLLEKNGIYFDNENLRLRPNVNPDGLIYVNFYESPKSDYLVITCTEKEPNALDPKLLYYASTYKFNHPGKPPVYVKPSKITPIKEEKKDTIVESTITTDTITEVINHDEVSPEPKQNKSKSKYNIVKEEVKINREDLYESGKIITIIKVIQNGEIVKYHRVKYDWGGVYYFKNNTISITEVSFMNWTGLNHYDTISYVK